MSTDRPSWVAGTKGGFFTHTNIHTDLDGIWGSPANALLCFAALPLVICKVTHFFKEDTQTIPNILLLIQFYKYTYTNSIHTMFTFLVSHWARVCFSSSNSSICRTSTFIILCNLSKLTDTRIFATNSPLNSNSGHFCTASSTERKSIYVIHRFLQPSQMTFRVRTAWQRALYSLFWFTVSSFQHWAKTVLYDVLETPLMIFTCSLQNRLYPVLKSHTYRGNAEHL